MRFILDTFAPDDAILRRKKNIGCVGLIDSQTVIEHLIMYER